MSEIPDIRLMIHPVPAQEEEDAVLATLLLHLRAAKGDEPESDAAPSRWAMAGRRRAHLNRLALSTRGSDLPSWLER
ncbi:MAG: hypothetical protein IT335_05355 [Thermomicrobiales bacterium]|nr:hypothetical protein [Thermomicrobiales bacterium]